MKYISGKQQHCGIALPFPLSFMEVWLTTKSCIYLGCIMWCFDTHILCEMITIIKLINIYIISHSYLFCVWWEHLNYSQQMLSIHILLLLTIVTMLYITSTELIYLRTKLPLTNIFIFHPPNPTFFSLDFTNKWYCAVYVFLYLISFT